MGAVVPPTGAARSAPGAQRVQRALVVDPDPAVQRALDAFLAQRGFLVTCAPDGERAMTLIEARQFSLAVVELELPVSAGLRVPSALGADVVPPALAPRPSTPAGAVPLGFDFIEKARARRPGLPVIALCSEERYEWAVTSLRLGLLDYVVKPPRPVDLGPLLQAALDRRKEAVDAVLALSELKTATDEILRHLVRLHRESVDLKEKLEADSEELGLVAEYNLLAVTSDEVLLVDLGRLAAARNMRLTQAQSGEEALRMIDELYFNMVVVDEVLPGINGVEVVKRIHARAPDTEQVIVVGFTSADAAIRAMELGAGAFLVKPIDLAQAGERLDGVRSRQELSVSARKYLAAFRERYREFLDRYESVRHLLRRLKPEDL
jgi:DNA-binding response OmpR family regulator